MINRSDNRKKIIRKLNKIKYKIMGLIGLFFLNVRYGFFKTFLICIFIINQIILIYDFTNFCGNKNSIGEVTSKNLVIFLIVIIITAIIGYIIRYEYFRYTIKVKNYSKKQKLRLKENINLSDEYLASGYEIKIFNKGLEKNYTNIYDEYYVMSKEINRKLQHPNCSISVKAAFPFVINDEVRTFVPRIMYSNFKSNRYMYNGKLLKQNQSLLLNDENELDVMNKTISKVGYYIGQCTNEIVFKQFSNNRKISKVFDGKELLVDDSNVLHELEDSKCANFLGASTLLFTVDNKILIAKQGSYSKSNSNRYAPTGSGSVEWRKDYKEIVTSNLCEIITHAMDRELREEWNLPDKKSLKIITILIGYARLIERGGKPDYFGISFTPKTFKELLSLSNDETFISSCEDGFQSEDYFIVSFDDDSDMIKKLKNFYDEKKKKNEISIQLHIIVEIMSQMEEDKILNKYLEDLRKN